MGFASLRIEFLNIIISKTNSEQVGITLDRIIGFKDLEVGTRRSGKRSVFLRETVFFLSFHFLQNDLFLEASILDDFVQC